MNTAALKPFAQSARKSLLEGVRHQLEYWGFNSKGSSPTEALIAVQGGYSFRGSVYNDASVPAKWRSLSDAVTLLGFEGVAERGAYTWFNRLMAVKILGKCGYESSVLDYTSPEVPIPSILEKARRGQYTFLTTPEKSRLESLLTDYSREADALALLLTGYCHTHPLLMPLFGAPDDYTELLLPTDIASPGGFIHRLNTITAISESDWSQPELIGWLYQFYISEKKDEVFKGFKDGKKAGPAEIPAATQIFTPNWIVKYMVQNTLGRTWLEQHPDSPLAEDWRYFIKIDDGGEGGSSSWNGDLEGPDALTFLDPAAGSGHILAEAFDLLFSFYRAEHYTPSEAVEYIFSTALAGLELDERAAGLARFALLLKAAPHHRAVLEGRCLPRVWAAPPPRDFSTEEVARFLGPTEAAYVHQLTTALLELKAANNLGSIIKVKLDKEAREAISERLAWWKAATLFDLEDVAVWRKIEAYLEFLLVLAQPQHCIAANPPYMGQKNMNGVLKQYVNEHYPRTKSDLFAVFMDVCSERLLLRGRYAMINQHSWMFLSSYEQLREHMLACETIESMLHLGARTFDEMGGEVVQSTAFVSSRAQASSNFSPVYYRLLDGRSCDEKMLAFEGQDGRITGMPQISLANIPGSPIAYWASEKIINAFSRPDNLESIAVIKQGATTSDNERFLRMWWEVSISRILMNCNSLVEAEESKKKWFLYNKGGGFRKWYGNHDYLVNYESDGKEMKQFQSGLNQGWNVRLKSREYYFKPSVSWSKVTGSAFAARYYPTGFIFDVAGCSMFPNESVSINTLNALLNSKLVFKFLEILSPTLNFEIEHLKKIPFVNSDDKKGAIEKLSNECRGISKRDWDSRETSWNFSRDKLIDVDALLLSDAFNSWLEKVTRDFKTLHENEQSLNSIFAKLYDLEDELIDDVSLRDITILQEELDYNTLPATITNLGEAKLPVDRDVVVGQLISYIVGLALGRYRLDKPGLCIAHPPPYLAGELAPYTYTSAKSSTQASSFQIDEDGIIPLMGTRSGFTDDAVYRVREVIEGVWGSEGLTTNLNFVQACLGKDWETWLVRDFWKYHLSTYSKKPIYWLFSSLKGAFQVLIYMHRMTRYTLGKLRSKYLLPYIARLSEEVERLNRPGLSTTEAKRFDAVRKALVECQSYDLLLKDAADRQIEIDLDNGVTRNHGLFAGLVAPLR